jgi:hypothetical protein
LSIPRRSQLVKHYLTALLNTQKLFEKLTQSRKVAEKRGDFGGFYRLFAFFAPLPEMNSTFSNNLSEKRPQSNQSQ